LTVSDFSSITHIIIPLLNKYPIIGYKFLERVPSHRAVLDGYPFPASLDYNDGFKVFQIMLEGGHLTKKGLDEILVLKKGMRLRPASPGFARLRPASP
jgi:hypothetical protein